MNKKNGFTLLELLVVIGIIALLSVLAIVSLSNIREKGRDTERLSDMDVLRGTMEAVNNGAGGYDSMLGCAAGVSVSSCLGGNLETKLPTLRNMNDPIGVGNCASDCVSGCNYGFKELSAKDYSVYFFLEKGVANFSAPGCYKLTRSGVSKI